MININDRISKRLWSLDLSTAGTAYAVKVRPACRSRQKVVRFIDRKGTTEFFEIMQTIPYCEHGSDIEPSQSQYGAVCDFFVEPCETRFEAHLMLCARDYAKIVAQSLNFTAPRKRLIWLAEAAFILSDSDLRSTVRAWSNKCRSEGLHDLGSGIAHEKPYKLVTKFASKLVDDMRGAGAEIFG